MSGQLLAVYIFGSVARADADDRSDLDILAVVADGEGKVPEREVLKYVPDHWRGLEPSISWYGIRRLRSMFRNGELFSWHLYQESLPVFEDRAVMSEMGTPSRYTGGYNDLESFEKILSEIPERVRLSPGNAAYELGLVYVCLRNIGMSASAELCDSPNFSRYSPLQLNDVPQIPMGLEEYEVAMACRMSGQRGLAPPPGLDPEHVIDIYKRVAPWIAEVKREMESRRGRG